MNITQIPLAQIDAEALPRDRLTLDDEALAALQRSVLSDGLRQPIEVFPMQGRPPFAYGLISGLRRLTVFRTLATQRANGDFATIPALIRTPASIPAALAAMVTENEIRADPSPWDKGRILVKVVADGHFPTLDAAVTALYPHTSRQKRSRLRAAASVVDALDGLISTPDQLVERQIERMSSALRGGFVELIEHILREYCGQSLATQWSALLSTLNEANKCEEEIPATPTRPGRPRRMLSLPQGLVIRREVLPNGYALRFTGPEARKGALMDDIMDLIERWCMPAR